MTTEPRDIIAETLCNIERGKKGVGYFLRHGEQADVVLNALAESGWDVTPREVVFGLHPNKTTSHRGRVSQNAAPVRGSDG